MLNLGWLEVGVILGAAMLIFGPQKITQLGSSLGKTLRNFREGWRQPDTDDEK